MWTKFTVVLIRRNITPYRTFTISVGFTTYFIVERVNRWFFTTVSLICQRTKSRPTGINDGSKGMARNIINPSYLNITLMFLSSAPYKSIFLIFSGSACPEPTIRKHLPHDDLRASLLNVKYSIFKRHRRTWCTQLGCLIRLLLSPYRLILIVNFRAFVGDRTNVMFRHFYPVCGLSSVHLRRVLQRALAEGPRDGVSPTRVINDSGRSVWWTSDGRTRPLSSTTLATTDVRAVAKNNRQIG